MRETFFTRNRCAAASAKAALMSDPTFLGKLRSSDMVVRAAAIRQLAALNQAMAG